VTRRRLGAPPFSGITDHPRATAVAGALAIAWSSILVKLSESSPSTVAVFRCLYALPLLGLIAWLEDRRLGPRPRRGRAMAALAGVFFAVDLVFWHHSIENVGAGLATVLANVQVVLVPLIAWMWLGERPGRQVMATIPVVLTGIMLISGVLEEGAYGEHPAAGVAFGVGTGLTYAGFLLALRAGGADLRRPAGPLFDATAVGGVVAALIGLAWGDLDLVPRWPSAVWLVALALTSQVLGWLLISSSLPRLPAATTSVILTLQPVGSVVLAVLIFSESPTLVQLLGTAMLLTGVVLVTRRVSEAAPVAATIEPCRPPA
jgi:drug/metabolite transporter (DMT)-like permease